MIAWTPEMMVKLGTNTDRHVAYELGVSTLSVRWQRCINKIAPFHKHVNIIEKDVATAIKADRYSDSQIASKFNITINKVAKERRAINGKSSTPEYKPSLASVALNYIMWRRCTDAQISHVIGVTREYVRQMRIKYGDKCDPGIFRKPFAIADFSAWASKNEASLQGKCLDEIISQYKGLPVSATVARVVLKNLGISVQKKVGKMIPPVLPWDSVVNWKLRNVDLSDIWNYNHIHTRRYHYRKGPCVLRVGTKEYADALEAEKMVASQWIADHPNYFKKRNAVKP